MLSDRIIGRVAATVLAGRLANARQADGSLSDSAALFRLDKLASSQIAAIVREIISSPQLSSQVELKIPASLVANEGLPEHCLTDLNAGAVRNIGTSKEALLTANGNEHNLADTLGHVAALGAKELREHEVAWVEATCHVASIVPSQEDRAVFTAALRGLIAVTDLSLIQLSEFCNKVSEAYSSPLGYPIRDALGWSLPFVGLPRDTSFFSNSKTYGSAAAPWRKSFEKLFTQRAPLLARQRANGQPLDSDEMSQRLSENIELIETSVQETMEAFINAPVGDQSSTWNLSLLEWEKDNVHLIFEKPRERQRGLADSTVYFFAHDCSDNDVLAQNWLKHLEEMKVRERRSEWNEDDEVFFETHRRYIEQAPKLHAHWEKVIFGKPIECSDFFEGILSAAHQLIAGAVPSPNERILRLTVNKGRKEWRERFNHDVGAYFSVMYRGLKELLGSKVDWKVEKLRSTEIPDPLFQYPEFFKWEVANRKDSPKRVSSIAKAAVQIKFEVALVERRGDIEEIVGKTQLMWSYRPQSIGLSLFDDMVRIQEKGSVGCTEVPRRLVSKKGGVQSVSLLDTATLEATFSRDAGSLVPPPNKLKSLRAEIKRKIDDLTNEGRISQEQRTIIRTTWDTFEADYIKALDDFINIGLHGEAVLQQAESFSGLLKALATHARGDVCRSRLIADVLSIGTVRVSGEQPCVIIPPWHPERMKALAVKTRRVAGLISYILSGSNVLFGDRGIFFREFSEELIHPFYPEIAVLQRNGSPILVSESSTVNGYSLMERPVQGEDDSLTDVDPASAAKQVQELLARYVGLQPHESSNLSVLLYNADAAELPLAVVRELANLQFESSLQCGVAVRHRDPAKLRRVYAELVTKAGDNPDLPVVSETSENFISKLRISVVPTSATPVKGKSSFKPYDIAFLHDVVSRTANAEWIPVNWSNDCSSLEHAPSRWSYRSVSGENELKSTTFLTCPRQTSSGWAYVSAVGSVVRQTDLIEGQYHLPARRISLQSESLRETLDDVHSLAEWVATYDELLDKRQLQANGVTVVRYRRASTNGRNMIVSSTSELRLLGVLIRRRLSELGLSLNAEEISEVSNRMKKDALSVSGDIVLRAAKRGVSAGEMLGLVMSRYLLEYEFKKISRAEKDQAFSVYFLLDDYADWLAQKESRIADILGLRVEECDGVPHLHVAVIESKYISSQGAAEARRSSKAQLLATLSTFRAALFGDPGRLDRDVWLARLADLLIDADIPPGCSGLLERARSSLRDGSALISLRGYSHIFIHDIENVVAQMPTSEQFLVDDSDGIQAWQEVFERSELRSLIETYAHKADPTNIRAKLGSAEPWANVNARPPAARVAWTAMMELLPSRGTLDSDDLKLQDTVIDVQSSPSSTIVKTIDISSATKPEPETLKEHPSLAVPESNQQMGQALSRLISSKFVDQSNNNDEREGWAEETTKKLKSALNGYGFQAAVLGTRLTPNGCLVRLAGSDRLRVEDIEAKRTQLLTTHAINLVTVQPKPGEIVVTIASAKRQSVSMWDLWSRRSINRNAAGINTSFVLGLQEINGTLLYLNLGGEFGGLSSHEPHSLVAGATGSGKSVLIQAILLDIAATNPVNLAQIILIDPKMGVDYAVLEDLPHMREKIITTRERATEVLSGLVDEMENRYRLFAAARARDLTTFNAKSLPEDRLPMLFLVHDEFADWMLDDGYKGAVSAAVQRLGVKARAAGIHLIFAAQRPDKDVMPMQLRENLGNRLILKVASEATSKIALDRAGAELLLGKGHLAAKLNGEQGLVFAQAPFLSDQDIEAAVMAIKADCGSTN
jgi:S-DNA-T family DNA segregation ATPase FtsK/SpoIIIE